MTRDYQMQAQFDMLPWHDAVLLAIVIDRQTPGLVDEVRLLIEWSAGNTETLVFLDCLDLEACIGFGIIAKDSILRANCFLESPGLAKLKERWHAFPVTISDLKCFEIETSSTGSIMRVYAKGFSIEAAAKSGFSRRTKPGSNV